MQGNFLFGDAEPPRQKAVGQPHKAGPTAVVGPKYPSAGPASGSRAKERSGVVRDSPAAEFGSDDLDRPYFVARMNENGELEHSETEKQFIIPVDSEVRFRLDYGVKISRGARLLVNKPKRLAKGELEYTIT